MRLGQPELRRSRARPGPGPAPRGQRVMCGIGLEVIARAFAFDAGEQERVDPRSCHAVEDIGRDQSRGHHCDQSDQHLCRRPGDHQQRHPHQAEDDRLAEIGLQHQQHRHARGHRPGDQNRRQFAVLGAQRQQPRDGDDEEGFQELGRLKLRESDAEPAPRTVRLYADKRCHHQHQHQQRAAADRHPPRH